LDISEEPAVRVRIEVFGRVQGVFFRDTLRRGALDYNVTGSAINRSDGSVEAVFEGPRESVMQMIELAKVGPRGAEVKGLNILGWEDPEGLTEFVTGGPSVLG
jgi:acylphosphatase